jgi:surface protein
MFSGCSSLLSFPDISNWNISNVIYMNDMFSGCNSLSFLPDISKWNTDKVTNMSYIFNTITSWLKSPKLKTDYLAIYYIGENPL